MVTQFHNIEFHATSFQELLETIHQPDIDSLTIIFEEEKTIQDEH